MTRKEERYAFGIRSNLSKRTLLFVGSFSIVGVLLLVAIFAANGRPQFEAETNAPEAIISSDGAASDGAFIQFGDSGSSTGQFYIVGKDIIDPDGNVFYPIGSNAAIKLFSYPYVFEGGNGGANQHIQEIKDWNWNIIRATLTCDNSSGTPSMDALLDGLKLEVPKLTAEKIVVMLECHDLTGQNPTLNSDKEKRVRLFWDRAVEAFKDDPYVWFNIFNEPWDTKADATYSQIHTFYLDRIRATGAENIVLFDAPTWGQGLDELAETNLGTNLVSGKCNVMFEWHAYGSYKGQHGTYAQFEQAIQQVQARNIALIVGELGIALPAEAGNAGRWERNVTGFEYSTQLGPQYGVGLLWWNATGDTSNYSLYALKNDRTGYWSGGAGNKLTDPGQTYWNVSQAVEHNLGAFSGDLAASNCSSAQ